MAQHVGLARTRPHKCSLRSRRDDPAKAHTRQLKGQEVGAKPLSHLKHGAPPQVLHIFFAQFKSDQRGRWPGFEESVDDSGDENGQREDD